MNRRLNWDDLQYFLHVAKTGNLTQSALDLKVSQSTIARRISALEKDIKVTLFTRHQTGYYLTEQAKSIFHYAEEIEAKFMGLEHTAATLQMDVEGNVKLATAESLANHLIIPVLPKLYQKYPKLQLEIVSGINSVGFVTHEVDIALRFVRPEQNNLLVRRVGRMSYSLYAHQNYLLPFKKPYADNMDRYSFITWSNSYSHLPSAKWLAVNIPNTASKLVTTSVANQVASVEAGLGIAVLPDMLVKNNKELIAIKKHIFFDELWIVSYPELRSSNNIRAVIDFLVNELNETTLIDSI
ncbi:DNA-binding transcriptional LysR family regulator [Orbus hercynius]|uniref:DNA-binding transcriptional LysR family regulator n=1 Tax=Orbus hercynius TaxID=593135 RepID=A0A495RI93_9GAMM|nr:LysR family transcriptional regulator [Orbus hercynius]RKS87079.1 DNA-binding transcriptional LysR family regulator [Orbus hercynius]